MIKPKVKRVGFIQNHITGNFLKFHQAVCKLYYEDGTESEPYGYEYLSRKGLDCVAIALYRITENNEVEIGLINSVRTAAASRGRDEKFYLSEVVAGSLEPGESYLDIKQRVVEEVKEEAGIIITEDYVDICPGWAYPSVGQSNERMFYAMADVTGLPIGKAEGDGGTTESTLCPIEFIPVDKVLSACMYGQIQDMKTEVLAWRVKEKIAKINLK